MAEPDWNNRPNMLLTEGQVVNAVNAGAQLCKQVLLYARLFRTHMNGFADIYLPDDNNPVCQLIGFDEHKRVHVRLKFSYYITCEVPVYDSDWEGMGSQPPSSYSISSSKENKTQDMLIPMSILMKSEAEMTADMKQTEAKLKEQSRIKKLQRREVELKAEMANVQEQLAAKK